MILLTEEEIRTTKAEALRLSWTHKAHPSYEKDKYLLGAQLKKVVEMLDGIEDPPYHLFNAVTKYERTVGFHEAIQTIKQALLKEVE